MPSSRKASVKARLPSRPARKPTPLARPASKTPAKKSSTPAKSGKAVSTSAKPPAPAKSAARGAAAPTAPAVSEAPPRPGGRAHVLSLSFLRDGDEFLARLETDSGQITELKNRFLDQLLSLVANELEDLLE